MMLVPRYPITFHSASLSNVGDFDVSFFFFFLFPRNVFYSVTCKLDCVSCVEKMTHSDFGSCFHTVHFIDTL